MNMNRRLFASIPAILSVFFLCSCGNSASNSREEAPVEKLQYAARVNEVEVITLERKDFCRQLLSNGKLKAAQKSKLVFGTSGKISTLNVKNGDRVSAGALIAGLDRPDLVLSLESARLSLKKAELDLSDFLVGQGYPAGDTTAVPAQLMETARIRSGFSSARNQLSSAEHDVAGTRIRAPFSGRVADITLQRYDQAGQDAFCTIIDDSSLDVEFPVLESEYSFITSGMPVKVRPYADGTKEYSGTVTAINPSVDDKGQIRVTARVRNDGSLLDGMNVKVIAERSIPDQLVVPRSAVVIRDNLDVLFTWTDDGKAHWTYVTILHSNGDSYAVEANRNRNASLSEGDKVIISGNLNLADNSEVALKN